MDRVQASDQLEETRMRPIVKVLFLAGAVAGFLTLPAAARNRQNYGGHSLSIGSHFDDESTPVTECNQLEISFDDDSGARAEEELPAANLRSLKVDTLHHGGVRVVGWDRATFAVKACKAAAFSETLSRIRTTL